jgi:hypothetical protein
MRKLLSFWFFIACAALFTGCASGPTYLKMRNSMPPIGKDEGRIYFYRPATYFGSAIQPEVKLNNQMVGRSEPGGFFYVDRPPGNYVVKTTTEVVRTLSLTLATNQVRYVRFDVSMGFLVGHVYPILVESSVGDSEMDDCHYAPMSKTEADE